jgi:hypothetical protein
MWTRGQDGAKEAANSLPNSPRSMHLVDCARRRGREQIRVRVGEQEGEEEEKKVNNCKARLIAGNTC